MKFLKTIVLVAFAINLYAQEGGTVLSLNTIKTDLKESAIQIGIKYLSSLDSSFSQQDIFSANKDYLFTMQPEFNIETGNEDAFSSITAKMVGFWLFAKKDEVDNIPVLNLNKTFHVLPISGGIETDNTFRNINAIIEMGYIPWYYSATAKTPKLLKHTKVGLFLQGGYKFELDANNTNYQGGDEDESMETPNDPIFRTKGSFVIDTKKLIVHKKTGWGIGLIGETDGWYDFLNSEVYYRIEGKVRFYLSPKKFFDFKYEKGSGAPNFNQGDQFGLGLTVEF